MDAIIQALGDSLKMLDAYSASRGSGKASVSGTSHSSGLTLRIHSKSPLNVSASLTLATLLVSESLPESPRGKPVCTSSPADLLTVEAGKIDPDATEILEGKDDVAVIEINKPCPGEISVPTSQKKMPRQDTGSRKR